MGVYRQKRRMLFEDRTGIRAVVWKTFLTVFVIGVTVWAGDFFYRIQTLQNLEKAGQNEQPAPVGLHDDGVFGAWSETRLQPVPDPACQQSRPVGQQSLRPVYGFLPADDPRALAGFLSNCSGIDRLIREAFVLDGETLSLSVAGTDPLAGFDAGSGPEELLSITPGPELTTQVLEAAFADATTRTALQDTLLASVAELSPAGVCLDLTNHFQLATDGLVAFLRALATAPQGVVGEVCVIAGPEADAWRRSDLTGLLDRAVVLGFRQSQSSFEPLAPDLWFADAMAEAAALIPDEIRVVALGAFGELWPSGSGAKQQVSFGEAVWLSGNYGGFPGFSGKIQNTQISFANGRHGLSRIWLLDAVSIYNQLRLLGDEHAVAVWPLGYEDPAIWQVLSSPAGSAAARNSLNGIVNLSDRLLHIGQGTHLSDITPGNTGNRSVGFSVQGQAVANTYDPMPQPVVLEHRGATDGGNNIVVTFNGMANEKYRDDLLQILADRQVPATFFLSDLGVLGLGEEIDDVEGRGHYIGALAYNRPVAGPIEKRVSQLFNNGTQHVLSYLTGHRASLIRAARKPLDLPETPEDFQATAAFMDQGYIPVATGIDWQTAGSDTAKFLELVRKAGVSRGTTVLTFDLTTPRVNELINALPGVLEALDTDGFQFRSLSEAGELNPTMIAPPSSGVVPWRDAINYRILNFWFFDLTFVFVLLLVFAVIRSLIYLALALVRKESKRLDKDFHPGITVIVPAYNEASVIVRSVKSILESDYPNFEVVVVDDGSSDGTSAEVERVFAAHPQVRLLRQQNGGKWRAENNALNFVTTPFFVGVDADTVLDRSALSWLVQQFKDENVGAVAGFVEVGNSHSFLTLCQKLEYMVSQSVTRRAFETFNGIFVVPGAIGAWRMDAVREAGRYSGDTITEDADLTVAIHRAGYKVMFQENARAYTEAPEKVASFLKQRLRWTLGMLQTSWKHRGAIPEGRAIGFISIIDAIWFSLLTSIISPLVDLLLLIIGLKLVFLLLTEGTAGLSGFPLAVVISYFILVTIDVANTLAAFWFEKRFDLKLLLLTPILRFGYRQLIYISSIRAIVKAVTGRLPGWEKLDRSAVVLTAEPAPLKTSAPQQKAVFKSVRGRLR